MRLFEELTMGSVGGLLYVGLELLYRGRSHVSMFVVGGVCFLVIGALDRAIPGMPLLWQMLLGGLSITAAELLAGLIVNVRLQLHVWDYSGCPLNFMGQICLQYALLWLPLALAAAFLDDLLRWLLFSRTPPGYCWL